MRKVSFALSTAMISRARRATTPRRHLLLSTILHSARGGLDYAFTPPTSYSSLLCRAAAMSSPPSARCLRSNSSRRHRAPLRSTSLLLR